MIHLQSPVARDIVLLGGGHAHVIVMKKWAMRPIPGIRLTLVSRDPLTPYSGMLPGLIAGHYGITDSHIDLARLCRWSGIRFIADEAVGVSLDSRTLQFSERPDIEYDYLSIDTGSTPSFSGVQGADQFATPVKPVHRFYDRWRQIEEITKNSVKSLDIGVVGAGAGGFEILLAMHHRLTTAQGQPVSGSHRFHWIIRDGVLSAMPKSVQARALKLCRDKGIHCHHQFDVAAVMKGKVISVDNQVIELDEVLWCTEARSPDWPRQAGLQCDERGFIAVDDFLRSLSHQNIFAAGDIATQINHPRPKAGVFAVRQGPMLFENLQRTVLQKALKAHMPQRSFLTILSCGRQYAIASKHLASVSGKWVWKWKDWIDRRFMAQFNQLPEMRQAVPGAKGVATETQSMRCDGCGAKTPGDILKQVLGSLTPYQSPHQQIGLAASGDVAVVRIADNAIAQSVDQLRSFISDPWLFARIAAIHALSDLYAAGAEPQSALVTVSLPYSEDAIRRRDLTQLMQGVCKELGAARCELSGGHTSESAELALGLTVNGLLPKGCGVGAAAQAEADYALILTKPLGIGVLLAADMQGKSSGTALYRGIDVMLQSNGVASKVFVKNNVAAMTDVTGFGLIGHLQRMLAGLDIAVEIELDKVPSLEGALALSEQGIYSSLYQANRRSTRVNLSTCVESTKLPLLYDPQTSGGMIALVAVEKSGACIRQLHACGYESASIIGRSTPKTCNENLISIT